MTAAGQDVEAPAPEATSMRVVRLAAARVRALPAALVLTVLILASTAFRAWAGTRIGAPWVISDEITYSQLGRNLYLHGRLDILGRPVGYLSLVYPALIGPFFAFGDAGVAYAVTKGVQALVMSLTAVPVYLWSRSLVRPRWALTAAALTLALPGLAYSGVIMTEVAFVPVMTLAAWAMAAALARPSLRNQALVVAAIALAVATRTQAAALVPAFATAIVLKIVFDRRLRGSLRDFAPSLAVLGGLGVLWIVYRAAGGEAASALGGYQAVLQRTVDTGIAARFVMYHAADVVLLTAALPVCALAMLAVGAFRSETDENVRAYVAVASSLVIWLVLEVGTFATIFVGHLAERNLLPLAPVLFVGFVVWLDRGVPRPRYAGFLVATAVFVLLAALPLSRLVPTALPDAMMLVPFQRLQAAHPTANLDVVLPYVALPLLALFAFLPRRHVWLMPVAVGSLLIYTSVTVNGAVAEASRGLSFSVFGTTKDWIDRAAPAPVGYVYAGEDWNPVFESIFWNRRLENVYPLPATLVPGPLPQTAVEFAPSGVLVSADGSAPSERYFVTNGSVVLDGTPVASAPAAKLTLWRVSGRPRVSAWPAGVDVVSRFERKSHLYVVGTMGQVARLDFYGCRGGTLRATLSAGDARTVTISRGDTVARRVRLRPGVPQTVAVPARPSEGRCEFNLATSEGFVQLQLLEFVRR